MPRARTAANDDDGGPPVGRPATADSAAELEWETRVGFLSNPVVLPAYLKFVLVTTAVVLAILLLVLVFGGTPWRDVPSVLGLVGLICLGLWTAGFLIAMVIYAGGLKTRFVLHPAGVSTEIVDRRSRFVNRATVIAGALRGNPTAAGAGMLAMAGERSGIAWRDIRVVKRYPRKHTLLVKGRMAQIVVIAPPELWERVDAWVRERARKATIL